MSSYIRQIQTDLKNKGFYKGSVDGIAGKMTVQAVREALKFKEISDDDKRAVIEQNQSSPMVDVDKDITSSQTAKHDKLFFLGERSLKNLQGVNPNLVKVVKRAIEITEQDFMVIEGLRTRARQAELVKKGASKTMNSKHLTGHAVDIAPVVDGKISWDFNHYYPLAKAMSQAAAELNTNVRWGGAWTNIKGKSGTPQEWVATYRKGGGRFLDGPHFELV